MLKNYLKTTFRFLLKNKTFSFINIIGLAMGTLCCLYILLYVADQYSYDKHHARAKDIYRVNSSLVLVGNKHVNSTTSSPPIGPALKRDFGEVEQFTRLVNTEMFGIKQHLLRYKEQSLYEKNAVFVDSTFFDVFSYHFVNGSARSALSAPYSIVLLQSTAVKLFGKENPVGKLVQIDNDYGKHDFKVTGVVDESLGKSHIHANIFIAMNSGGIGYFVNHTDRWAGENMAATYVRLQPQANAAALEQKLPAFIQKYAGEQLKTLGMQKQLHLQPVGTIHTTGGFEHELDKTVSPAFLYLLILIAALIQVIACINFMNLSTARASQRAKEVGVRKVIGANRKDLIKQFIGESFLLSLISVLVALPLLLLALPYLNSITGATIHLSFLLHYKVWLMLASLVVATGLVAGSYPAFYLSAFRAIKVIKGNFTSHVSVAGIRRSLVVFQFVLSIVLITGIIVIYSQLNYIKHKDLGFEHNQQLVFRFYTDDAKNNMPAFMNDLQQLPEVKAVSKASNYPSQYVINDWPFYLSGGSMATAVDVQFFATDEYFVKAAGLQLISGRDFRLHDSDKVIINETLARELGLNPATATGTRLFPQQNGDDGRFVEIAGVMKDFNYNSLHEQVKPFMLWYGPNGLKGWGLNLSKMIVNTTAQDYSAFLKKAAAIWQKDFPAMPFEYAFLDDEVQKQYETEITLSRIINSFTLIAILISCLGLFGLAAFSAEQRRKEIGIRKVLGASVSGIVQLLSKDFLQLVAVAIIIAVPIAWWAMHQWLQAFAYRVSVSWWMFALAGSLAIVIALCTVSFQAIKAAIANPVKSLRTE